MNKRPNVLIEQWLPVEEVGIESRRERAAASALPPISFLHVWWARRPLVASTAAILGSLMPSWNEQLRMAFSEEVEFENDASYRAWFLKLCGILGDPIIARKKYDAAVRAGVRIPNPYTYRQAYRNTPSPRDLALLKGLLEETWGDAPVVLDPTAGGGSIPFSAVRLGTRAWANDLNPVSGLILRSGVQITRDFSDELVPAVKRFGQELCARIEARLAEFFPSQPNEQVATFLFARTVSCPRTGKLVPLVPNWYLAKGKKPTAVRLVTQRNGVELDEPEFEIATGSAIDFDPDRGSVARGEAISPWDGLAIGGDYIKQEAQVGRMGQKLYAVVVKSASGRSFRSPAVADLAAVEAAGRELENRLLTWERENILPTEAIPEGLKTTEPHRYGIATWREMFSDRQLLVHGTFVEEFRRLIPLVREEMGGARGDAVLTLLGLMQAKAINYNAILASWHVSRETMRSVFERHDFAFKWTFAEFEGAAALYPWCLEQVVDAYSGIVGLLPSARSDGLVEDPTEVGPGTVTVTATNAADLSAIGDGSVELVCIDPPYYDNVMYAELADFFYVWEKRTLGDIHPDLFETELTDKKNEAVANPARFKDAGRRKSELATADYEAKMTAIFSEAQRVMRENGVLCVMFTHKRAEAWDTLGMALMEAGFTIETSWPVNTESEHSLHQAKKNAAASTIFLVCRKRDLDGSHSEFYEDVEPEVREAARSALTRFREAGISGVDLLLSTYGPALSVISSRWPVLSSEIDEVSGRARPLRPEEALNSAREEVVRLQTLSLVGSEVQLDPLTDFVMIAWDTFKAEEFPYDEARRLALATGGLDVDDLVEAKLIAKKAGMVVLQPPAKRIRKENDTRPGVRREATSFQVMIDAVHTAVYLADADGLPAAKVMMDRAGLSRDGLFVACLQGLVNSIPRTIVGGKWVRREAETIDRIVTAYFAQIEVPQEQTPAEELRFEV